MRSSARRAVLIVLMVIAVMASSAAQHFLLAQSPEPARSYVLGAEDTIEINVWTHGDLTRTVTVRGPMEESLFLL